MTTPRHYYNEIDPFAAQWLRNLIAAGVIYPGDVDERSIEDVTPADLAGYTQCHFFAGIAGWQRALQLAHWPVDRPVWTGSCPCQPFSAAGKGAGFADERHLWPAWFHLIEQCRPAVVFGEQVASAAVDAWVDLVHADLEGVGYAFQSVPFPAAGVGAPHIRGRNIWVADTEHGGFQAGEQARSRAGSVVPSGVAGRLADADGGQLERLSVVRGNELDGAHVGRAQGIGSATACGDIRGLAYSMRTRSLSGTHAGIHRGEEGARAWHGELERLGTAGAQRPGPTNGLWANADWLLCRDGKWRPVEPGTFPLAHGVSGRVGRLRAYGNAIVPPAVAEFIKAYLACQP